MPAYRHGDRVAHFPGARAPWRRCWSPSPPRAAGRPCRPLSCTPSTRLVPGSARDSELWRVNRAGGRAVAVRPAPRRGPGRRARRGRATDGDVDPTCGRAWSASATTGTSRRSAGARPPGSPSCPRRLAHGRNSTRAAGWPGCRPEWCSTSARPPRRWRRTGPRPPSQAPAGCGVLVNLGGDIRVAGRPQAGGWPVGIADDADFGGQSRRRGPRQRGHITAAASPPPAPWSGPGGAGRSGTASHRRPATGLPARTCWRAVSVTAASCVDANAASTAAIIRGERAPRWLAGLRLPARLVRHDGTVA